MDCGTVAFKPMGPVASRGERPETGSANLSLFLASEMANWRRRCRLVSSSVDPLCCCVSSHPHKSMATISRLLYRLNWEAGKGFF